MWILTIAELFNAMAHQNDVINNLRLPVGGMPVGVMELFAAVLFLYAVLAVRQPEPHVPERANASGVCAGLGIAEHFDRHRNN